MPSLEQGLVPTLKCMMSASKKLKGISTDAAADDAADDDDKPTRARGPVSVVDAARYATGLRISCIGVVCRPDSPIQTAGTC